ncbi:FAD-dependent monooxygenase [Dactylosporangium sp. CA-092794]|uniref:FAD-dependent monooxygenase n=1 Tax=Dactylosporangium sp. CA-092794 TaxID=3239929 RepID=UPI003D8AFFE2
MKNTNPESPVPVLVVGAGPVGLSCALLLARHGIASTVIERGDATHGHPKARGVRIRTMELLRQWGLEPALRAQSLPQGVAGFIYCDSLCGAEAARSEAMESVAGPFSPTSSLRVAQDAVQETLLAAVRAEPLITLLLHHELIGVDQDEHSVTARVAAEEGREHRIRARYAVAADGVGSATRKLLGLNLVGIPVLGYWHSVYWSGDLSRWTADRPCVQYITGVRHGPVTTVAPVDGQRRWVTMVMRPPSTEPPASLTPEQARALIRGAVGPADDQPGAGPDGSAFDDIELLDITTWRLSAQVADGWRAGRVFLAGDAAHVFPPTGGFGMNAGIQDVHNLTWKLALVLTGRAGPGLLDTYEAERRPVVSGYADWSVDNSGRIRQIVSAIAADDKETLATLLDEQGQHVNAIRMDLGFTYPPPAALAGELESDAGAGEEFRPDAVPGRRAPHAWIDVAGQRRSTLDLFDTGFVLFVGSQASGWRDTAAALGRGDLVRVASPGDTFKAEDDEFERAYRLAPHGAILVRPDGHVAWRADAPPADPEQLRRVLDGLLG